MTAPTQQPTSRTGSQQTGADRHTLTDRSFHLIGIGGAGMSVVAQLLAARGARVSGSDAHGSPAFDHLSDLGITTHLGHDAANVPAGSTVVVSTAIKGTNPELAEARRRDQEVIHRSQALALAAQGLDFVAVAGAHGKTTTSGMLAEALTDAGADPSFAIGGVVRALGAGAHLGGGSSLVAEADESDRSFLNYTPRVEIVTNVEPDHLDTYGTTEAFEAAFVDFAHRLVPGGLLVACAADPGSLRLARTAAAEGLRVVTYSFGSLDTLPDGMLVGEGHVHLAIQERGAASTRARLTLTRAAEPERSGGARAGEQVQSQVELVLAVPGDHVALDAAGAWAAGIELGVEPAEMARALGSFGGTGRTASASLTTAPTTPPRSRRCCARRERSPRSAVAGSWCSSNRTCSPAPGPSPTASGRHWAWPTPSSSQTSIRPGRSRRTSPTSPGTRSSSGFPVAEPPSSRIVWRPPTRWPRRPVPATCC